MKNGHIEKVIKLTHKHSARDWALQLDMRDESSLIRETSVAASSLRFHWNLDQLIHYGWALWSLLKGNSVFIDLFIIHMFLSLKTW